MTDTAVAERPVQVLEQQPATNPVLAQASDAASLMATITRAASDPNVDVNKLERLWAMYERAASLQAEQAFNAAMNAAQAEMPRIVRDAENSSTNSRYAKLETIHKAIQPVVSKHGFSISYGTADCPLQGHYRVTAKVSHVGGHSRDYQADIPSDTVGPKGNVNKTPTHGWGSTMTYGRRNLELLIFNLTLVNQDDDGNAAGGNNPITAEELAELQDLLAQSRGDPELFCKYMKVPAMADILQKDMRKAREALNNAINEYQRKHPKAKS